MFNAAFIFVVFAASSSFEGMIFLFVPMVSIFVTPYYEQIVWCLFAAMQAMCVTFFDGP